eukprot:CAMPEP_0117486790 /NCGR_PEP_ID=MMETSP0784-20121206/15659_1 /TAXON_ID=39447 /ORGANISM="" /LENGTH=75 /DNA_ID=CAMNT_0005281413 /DNA_START=1 /DNA_END=225 /DNA_ORIENTATION=+
MQESSSSKFTLAKQRLHQNAETRFVMLRGTRLDPFKAADTAKIKKQYRAQKSFWRSSNAVPLDFPAERCALDLDP